MILYNEFDHKAAAWLRGLVSRELIPYGDVDERSIVELKTAPKVSHFFAGIGGWPLALDIAGWPRDLPVWTGSCPCQPFSSAGKKKAEADDRHLWPEFLRLIAECRPPTIFGEQVASPLGRKWLAGVRADLEALGYAVGAADLCAASVGAPHIRQRLFWVAYCETGRWMGNSGQPGSRRDSGAVSRTQAESGERRETARGVSDEFESPGSDSRMGNAVSKRLEESPERHCEPQEYKEGEQRSDLDRSNFWSDFDLVHCYDGKTRRIESGTFPLADGVPGRVGLLRGYGNAIVPQVAAVFVKSFMEAVGL